MTIQPEHVRFAFGTSVRTYDGPATPQAIIAPIFRDVGQPDTGLTPAVEQIAGVAMRRMARASKRHPQPIDHSGEDSAKPDVHEAKRKTRKLALLRLAAQGAVCRPNIMTLLGLQGGSSYTRIKDELIEARHVTSRRIGNVAWLTITDAGRAWLAAQEATASQERPA